MKTEDKTRLADLRLRYGMGLELEPHEYHELLNLEAKERVDLQEMVQHADSEFPLACAR